MPARRHRRKSSGPMVSKEEGLRIREMAARYSLMWGYQDVLGGKTVRAQDALPRIRSERGW